MTTKKIVPLGEEPQGGDPDTAIYLAREKVIREMPTIIDGIIDKAKDGSYQHAKFLLEFASSGGEGKAEGQNEESLAALLLEALREGTTEPE